MKNILKLRIASLLVCTALLTSGYTNSFDDINTDPDALTSAPPTNILGNILRYTGSNMGNDMDGYGTFAGYIVKIQYLDYMSDLIPTNNTFGNRWSACYYNNTQLKGLLANTEESADELRNIRYVARIWQNYMWQYATDGWRDPPFTEALQGSEAEGSILQPRYDKQEDIYPAVLSSLKEIADEMATTPGTDEIGEGDFIYAGNVSKWQKFCNSLRLRMAMRISGVSPELSKSTIEEIMGNPSKYPIIESNDESCYLWWQGSSPYFEPWYNDSRTRDDHGMSDIFIDYMKSVDDPRLASIAKPATSDGQYRGFQNGPANAAPISQTSRIGAMYRDDPAGLRLSLKHVRAIISLPKQPC